MARILCALVVCIGILWTAEPCPGQWDNPRAAGPVAPWRAQRPQVSSPMCEKPHPAVCRVWVRGPGNVRWGGTGTLVQTDGSRSVVLTCYHIFRGCATPLHIELEWPNGQRSVSQQATLDIEQELAAIVIPPPSGITPVEIDTDVPKLGETAMAAGWGPASSVCYRTASGKFTGYVSSKDRRNGWMVLTGEGMREGDSGGPIFNLAGKLRGVLWGSLGHEVHGSSPQRILAFLRQRERMVLPWNAQGRPCPWHAAGPQCPCRAPIESPSGEQPGEASHCPPSPPPASDELAAIRDELAELRAMIAAVKQGPPVIDYAAVAAEVSPLLPPLTFQPVDSRGDAVGAAVPKRLGDTVKLHSYLVETPD